MYDNFVICHVQGDTVQSQEALTRHLEVTKKIRVAAHFASTKAAERSIRLSMKRRPPTVYDVGDDVLVRPASKKLKALNKSLSVPSIAEGKVVMADKKQSRYKIMLGTGEIEWYTVSNITSCTVGEERKKHKAEGII